MPRQNRVLPTGEIVADPARGRVLGNRGCLHDAGGALTRRRWRHKRWVLCLTAFKGRRATLNAPGRYTQLFFHDEAVGFAAGHRPCAECRRGAYDAFRAAAGIEGAIDSFDRDLHAARAVPRIYGQRRHDAALDDLPDGAFILETDGAPALVLGDAPHRFRPGGYLAPRPRPHGTRVTLLTPPPLVAVLKAGYAPQIEIG
ncbi:MAG TPA: hypothetical protein DEA05_11915 [Rhodobacteraceae bacterium]|nr:hypothetical protein [Paracoccaceae bacterium]